MNFPTFDAEPKKLNISKIGSLWCFKRVCGNPEKFHRLQLERGRENIRNEGFGFC